MGNTITLNRSLTTGQVPTTADVALGELVQNAVDGKVFQRVYVDGTTGNDTIAEVFIHPTTAGNKHIPAGGTVGQILSNDADGSAEWITNVVAEGDMAKAVYDVNANGTVDNAEKVNGLTVETAVPSGALFTDTIYTDADADLRVQAVIIDTSSTLSTVYSSSKVDSLISGSLTYRGTWDANTNTPTISDATGSNGDYYKVSVSGTQDLGSGAITFNAGNSVIHNGTVYEKSVDADTVWGSIIGDITSQADLQTALGNKVDDSQVLTDVPAGAVFTDTTYVSSDFSHDSLTGVNPTQHIDWSLTNAKNIHTDNYTDTTYTVGNGGLTEVNFTTSLNNKLAGIAISANNYVHPTNSGNKHIPSGGNPGEMLTNISDGTAQWITATDGDMTKAVYDVNENGIVDDAAKVNGLTVEKAVPSNAVFTDTTYAAGNTINISGTVINHDAGNGNNHIPINGEAGKYLKWSAAGNASWEDAIAGAGVATVVGGTNVAVDATDPANPIVSSYQDTFTGDITENSIAMPALALDPSNGTVQYKVMSGSETWTDSLTEGQSMTLIVTNALTSGASITFPTVKWAGAVPTMTDDDTLTFYKINSVLRATAVANVSA